MDRMLTWLPCNYKPDLGGLYLCRLPSDVQSHLFQEKVSDPRGLALKANELFQSKTSSPVNLLSEDELVQVNAVSTRTHPSCPSTVPLPENQLLWLHPTVPLVLLVPAGTTRSMVIKLRTARSGTKIIPLRFSCGTGSKVYY